MQILTAGRKSAQMFRQYFGILGMKSGFCLSILAAAVATMLSGCGSNAELCQKNFQAGNYGDALKYCSADTKNQESRYTEALINIDAMIPLSDQTRGLAVMSELAASGDHRAILKLARVYSRGAGSIGQDPDKALEYYRQDVAHWDPESLLEYAALAIGRNRASEVLPVLEELVTAGNNAARKQLGMYFVMKKNPTEQDYLRAIDLLKPVAEEGDAEAPYTLGWIYRFQEFVRDPVLAEKYFCMAAEKGNHLAADMMLTISREKYQENNTPETRANFRKWIRINADYGAHNAENLMGLDYLTGFIGNDIEINEEEGLKWLIRSVDGENVNGMYYLAKYYLHRYQTPEYFRKAAILLREAALRGQNDASRDLGEYLVQGRLSFSENEAESQETREENRRLGYYFLDKASQAGDYKASERLGALLISGKYGVSEPEEGVKILELAMRQGSRVAPCILYEVYRDGMGSIAQNHRKAVSYLYTAVEAGNTEAALYLATLKENGRMGVARDTNAALNLLRDACKVNEPRACYRLGEHYLRAREPDYAKAYDYFTRAASRGMPEAYNTLGNLSYEGKLAPDSESQSNIQAAMKYYAQAAEKKYPEAMENMARLYEDGRMFREAYRWYMAAESCGARNSRGESLLQKLSSDERDGAQDGVQEFLKTNGCTAEAGSTDKVNEVSSLVSRTADAAPGSEVRLYDRKGNKGFK